MLAFDEPSNINESLNEDMTTCCSPVWEKDTYYSTIVENADDATDVKANTAQESVRDYYLSSDSEPKQETYVVEMSDAKVTVNLHTYTTWSTDVIFEGGPEMTDKLLKNIGNKISRSNNDALLTDGAQVGTESDSSYALENRESDPTDEEKTTDLLELIGTTLSEKFGQFLQLLTGSSDEVSDSAVSSDASTADQNTESEDIISSGTVLDVKNDFLELASDEEEKSIAGVECPQGKCFPEPDVAATVSSGADDNTVAEPVEDNAVRSSSEQVAEQATDVNNADATGLETDSNTEKKVFTWVFLDKESDDEQSYYDYKDFFSGLPIA